MGIDSAYNLAIEFQDEAQHAMGRRMLRTKIDGEISNLGLGHGSLLGFHFRLFIAGKQIFSALPWGEIVEGAKLLGELHLLVDDALLLIVVANLDMAGEGKILAQRMTRKAIVGKNAPQVWIPEKAHHKGRKFPARTSRPRGKHQ